VFARPFERRKMLRFLEQIFQAEQGPDAFVERILVGNHAAAIWLLGKMP